VSFLSFSLTLSVQAQKNGTLVATCTSLPIIAAGHDAGSLAHQLVKVLRNVVSRVEAMSPSEAADYLASHGIESAATRGSAAIGFDEKSLRKKIKNWAAKEQLPLTLQFPVAA
jgi:hypothetical protein